MSDKKQNQGEGEGEGEFSSDSEGIDLDDVFSDLQVTQEAKDAKVTKILMVKTKAKESVEGTGLAPFFDEDALVRTLSLFGAFDDAELGRSVLLWP